MSLLDLFRKKTTPPTPGEPTPAPASPALQPAAAVVPTPSTTPAETVTVAPSAVAAQPAEGAPEPAQEPSVRVFDEFGREVLIPVSQWRRELLPQALQGAYNNPEALSAVILDALQTGAAAEILPAAAHLQAIDTLPERGAAVHGLVLLAANQPAQAEDVLITYLGQFGPSAAVLTHLARAQAAQNRVEEADATLWRALEADPNDDGAVGLYAARSREREGDFGWQSALERAATLPGAWLPLLWLGRSALEARNRTLAVGLYKQAIERAGRPAPTLLLQGVSGDLGQFGLIDDALRLVRPAFAAEAHGMIVGNNLLRALLDSGQPAEALALVRDLGRLQRPEFAEPLRAWELEIRRRELMTQASANPPQPQLLRIDGPVWLPPSSPSRNLYSTNPRRGSILFLGSSVSLPEQTSGEAAAALPDTAGRLSRALPLFLAENAFALLALDTRALVPWAEIAGFAMLSQPWPEDAAASYARDAGAGAAVTTHVDATAEGATVTLRLIPATAAAAAGASGEKIAGSDDAGSAEGDVEATAAEVEGAAPLERVAVASEPISITFAWPELHNAAQSLWPQLAIQLVSQFGDAPEPPRPGRYAPPRGTDLNTYLRLLEQLLAINCAMSSRNAPLLVTGERETLRAILDLALQYPASLPVRLMLGEGLLRVRALHAEVLAEFVQPLRLLNERHPFSDAEAAELLAAQQGAALNVKVNAAPQPAV